MTFRHFLGATFSRCIDAVLRSKYFPLTLAFPRGVSWPFDIQRFLGTRSLGVLFDVGANTGQTLKGTSNNGVVDRCMRVIGLT